MFGRLRTRALASLAATKDGVRRALGRHPNPEQELSLQTLEERVLLSANPAAAIDVEAVVEEIMAAESSGVPSAETANTRTLAQPNAALTLEQSERADNIDLNVGLNAATDDDLSVGESDVDGQTELVIIDSSVADAAELVDDLLMQKAEGRQVDVLLLDNDREGVEQITAALADYSSLDAIHIVSHGTGGAVKLGSTWLRVDALDGVAGEIAQWGSAVGLEGDILFYGCDLAGNLEGQMLIEAISGLTGADVAASTDDTGPAVRNGDWELEFNAGSIEHEAPFSESLQSSWGGLLQTFLVTTNADSGAGSLRQAINDANSQGGTDTIEFSIAGGPQTIQLLSALPSISDPVILDAKTQPGFSGSPIIELAGNGLGFTGLTISSGNSTVSGFVINGFTSGIDLKGGNNVVQTNFIGTNLAGETAVANSGNGIFVNSAGNTIGGTNTQERNVISGNNQNGIAIIGASSTSNVIQGNYIGTNVAGTTAIGNTLSGIFLQDVSATTIGGVAPGAGNVISGNSQAGIHLLNGANNVLQGNFIGTNATATAALPNLTGVVLNNGASSNEIGGTATAAGNIIAGNSGDGVVLSDATTQDNQLRNNFIGVNSSGTAIGNSGNGISINSGSRTNSIGDGSAGSANTIRSNAGNGIVIFDGSSTGNAIRVNEISANSGLAIDLGGDNVTANDPGDGDSLANGGQNFPEILRVYSSNTDSLVVGRLDSTPSTTFIVDFYTSTSVDPTGFGEAETYRGSVDVTTDSFGIANFSYTVGSLISESLFVTTVATSPSGDTSEVSQAFTESAQIDFTDAAEFRVNTTTSGDQSTSNENRGSVRAVAAAPNGNYVVTWSSDGQDGDKDGVYMRMFDASGTALTGEILVNQTTAGDQRWATVDVDATGAGVVVWTGDAGSRDVFARRFDPAGNFLGNEFKVNTNTPFDQDDAVVAMNANGQFAITWERKDFLGSDDIQARIYDSDGTPLTGEFGVTFGTQDRNEPVIAMNDNGDIAIAWDRNDGVRVKRYDITGAAIGSEITVTTEGSAGQASIGIANDGSFAVAWRQDGDDQEIRVQRFDTSGSPIGASFKVNDSDNDDQTNPSIAMDVLGNFAVTWEGESSGDDQGVYLKRYDFDGNEVTAELLINATTNGVQENSSIAFLDFENMVVVWSKEGVGDSNGVFARQLSVAGMAPPPPSNQAPVADAGGPYSIDEGDDVMLDASASDDNDNDPLLYAWDLDNDGNFGESGEPTTETATVPWATLQGFGIDDDGTYTIGLQVDDSNGGVVSTTATIVVANSAPELIITGTGTATAGGVYTLDLAVNDPGDDTVTQWIINWGDGNIETIAGNPSSVDHVYSSTATGFTFNILASATDEDGSFLQNELVVASYNHHTLFRFENTTGQFLDEFGVAQNIDKPIDAIVGPDGNLYVSGENSHDVQRFNAVTGAFIDVFVAPNAAGLDDPGGLAFGPDGNLYVADYSANRIMRFDGTSGAYIDDFVSASAGGLTLPYGLTFGPDGNLYVASFSEDNVRRYDGATGTYIDEFVSGGLGGLTKPEDLTFGPDGHLYVASHDTDNVLRYDGNTGNLIDEFVLSTSPLDKPTGLEFGPDGNLYVGDFNDDAILRFDGSTGAYIDEYVARRAGGLDQPLFMSFIPGHQVLVNPNPAPTADAGGAYSIAEGESITLDASNSDDPDDDLSFSWDLDNNGSFGDATGETVNLTWAQLQSFGIDDDGTHTITVQVDDGNGNIVTDQTSIIVSNTPPVITVAGAALTTDGGTYTLNFSATDDGADTISSWIINWGDGSSDTVAGTANDATHSYSGIGSKNGITVVAVDEDGSYFSGDAIVSSLATDSVFRFDGATGAFINQFGNANGLDNPVDVEIAPTGNVLASGYLSDDVQEFNPLTGAFIDDFVVAGSGGLDQPSRMAFGADGNLYVTNQLNNQVLRYNGSTGAFIDAFINGGGLDSPDGIAFGPNGFLYIANSGSGEITQHDPSSGASVGVFTTLPSTGNIDLEFGPDDNLYVSSVSEQNVRRFDSSGNLIDTFIPAGTGGLVEPAGIRFAPDGLFYVVDFSNNAVLRYDTTGAFVDEFVDSTAGLSLPVNIAFSPSLQVEVAPFDNRVNEDTSNQRQETEIASDANGNYVVVWRATAQDGDAGGIYARRYDSNGIALGGEFLVNTTTVNGQFDPDIDMDQAGNFVISWTSLEQDGDAPGMGNIYARAFDATGVAQGSEFRVNSNITGNQFKSSLTVSPLTGDFLVTWSSDDGGASGVDVMGRLFDSTGVALGPEFVVTETSAGLESNASATSNLFGEYFVAWDSDTFEGNGTRGIVGRYLNADGTFLTGEFGVNLSTAGPQLDPSAASNANGDIVVSWTGSDADGLGIFATVVSFPLGQPVVVLPEFAVNDATANEQNQSSVATNLDGNAIITWMSEAQDGDTLGEYNVYAKSYTATNSGLMANAAAFLVNPITAGSQQRPAVTSDSMGDVVIAWDGAGISDIDGIFHAQFLAELTDTSPTLVVDTSALAYTENSGNVPVDNGLTLTDPDDAQLTFASIRIRDGYDPAADELRFTDQNGISGSWDPISAVLTLTGAASVADYEAALRDVQFFNDSDSPDTTDRTITFSVSDGSFTTGAYREIKIIAVDDPLIADPAGPYTAFEGVAITLSGNGSDLDNLVTGYEWDLSYDGITFNVDSTSQDVAMTAPDGPAVLTVALRVTNDAAIVSSIATTTVTVSNVAPVAVDDSGVGFSTNANASFMPDVVANDIDVPSDTLVPTSFTPPVRGTVTLAGDQLTFFPNGDFDFLTQGQTTTESFDYVVSDADDTDTGTVTIEVIGVNDAPTANDLPSESVPENSPVGTIVAQASGSDPDTGDTILWSIISGNVGTTFSIDASGEIRVANPTLLDFETGSPFSLIVAATDDLGATDTATITIAISPIDEPPVVNPGPFSITENPTLGQLVAGPIATDPENGTLTHTLTNGNTGGAFALDSVSGLLTVANPAAVDFESTPSFNLEVSVFDGVTTVISTVIVDVQEVNEAPTANDESITIPENSALGVLATLTATDPENESLTWALGPGAPAGFTLAANGELSVVSAAALDFESTPTHSIPVEVEDARGLKDQATVTVTLTNVNEPPLITGGLALLSEQAVNGTAVVAILAVDPDANSTLVYDIVGGDPNNAFSIDSTGQISVADATVLDFETTPTYQLSVTVSDGQFTQMTVADINLVDENESPTTTDVAFSVSETALDGTSVGFVPASDPDAGAILNYGIVGGDTNGAFAINSGTGEVTVFDTNLIDFETDSTYALTIDVSDGSLVDSSTFTINVSDENEAPTIADATFNVAELAPNGTSVGTLIASDQDVGDSLAFSILSGDPGGAFFINAATQEIEVADSTAIDFDTQTNYSLIVEVNDGTLTDRASIQIGVSDQNSPPQIDNSVFSVNEFASIGTSVGALVASDPDAGTSLQFSILSGNIGGAFSINATTQEVEVANSAAIDFETLANYTLVVEVSDAVLADTATVQININDQNDAPTIADAVFSLSESSVNGTDVGTLVVNDPDTSNTLQYTILSGNTGGAFSINAITNELLVEDENAIDFETQSVFNLVVEISDGTDTDTATIQVNLTDQNETPVATDAAFSIGGSIADGTIVGTVLATDPDAETTLQYSIASGNVGGAFSINAASGEIQVANENAIDFETLSSYSLVVNVTDGFLNDLANVLLTVNDENDAPVISNQSFSVSEAAANGTILGNVVAIDPDTDPISFSITGGNVGDAFSINAGNGQLQVADASAIDFEIIPNYSLTVAVTDGALTESATISIAVGDINERPTTTGLSDLVVNEDAATSSIDLSNAFEDAEDNDNQLVYQATSNTPGLLNLAVSGGALLITPTTNSSGSAIVNVQATDSGGLSVSTAMNVTVNPINDAPIARNDTYSLGTSESIDVDANAGVIQNDTDVDSVNLTASLIVPPSFGTLTFNADGSFIYVVDTGAVGIDSFTYELSDGIATSNFATARIIVAQPFLPPPPPEPPAQSPAPPVEAGADFEVNFEAEASVGSSADSAASADAPESSSSEASSSSSAEGPQAPKNAPADNTAAENNAVDGGETNPANNPISPTTPSGDSGEDVPVSSDGDSNQSSESNGTTESSNGANTTGVGATGLGGNSSSGNQLRVDGGAAVTDVELTDITRVINAQALAFKSSNDSEKNFDFATSLQFGDEDLSFVATTEFFEKLEDSEQSLEEVQDVPEIVVESAVVTTAGLSVGYIVWMIRSGYVLASVLSTMPVWKNIDPLPVLDSLDHDDEDDESLESMIESVEGEADKEDEENEKRSIEQAVSEPST